MEDLRGNRCKGPRGWRRVIFVEDGRRGGALRGSRMPKWIAPARSVRAQSSGDPREQLGRSQGNHAEQEVHVTLAVPRIRTQRATYRCLSRQFTCSVAVAERSLKRSVWAVASSRVSPRRGLRRDDRLVPGLAAGGGDLRRIVGTGHQVVERVHALRAELPRGEATWLPCTFARSAPHSPAGRRRGVEVQLVAGPAGHVALEVAVGADGASPRLLREVFRQRAIQLPFVPLRRPRVSPAFFGRPRGCGGTEIGAALAAGPSGASIAANARLKLASLVNSPTRFRPHRCCGVGRLRRASLNAAVVGSS